MQPSRRQLLGAALGAAGLARAPRWLTAAARQPAQDERVLVLVQLRGGNDGLNTIVPFEDELYHRARPELALRKQELLPLDELNGFHPSLARTARRYAEGGVRVLQGVGTPRPNLSHFQSQDVWDAGTADARLPGHGWLGRLADADGDAPRSPLARLAIGREVMPLALRAGTRLGCALPSLEGYRMDTTPREGGRREAAARRRAIEALNEPVGEARVDRGLRAVTDASAAARLTLDELEEVRAVRPGADYPAGTLGRDLSVAARVIAAGLPVRCVYVTLDDFDTHVKQAKEHRALLSQLDRALDAFLADLAARDALERTLVMSVSEFGRRVAQNGVRETAGTDHGAASVMLLAGGRVRGGLSGGQPELGALDADGNQPHSIDFRSVYAAVIEDWLGGDAEAVLGARYEKPGLFV